MTIRDEIWDMVSSLIEDQYQEGICLHEGIKENEAEVQDIVEKIEEFASTIEAKIRKDIEQEPDAYDEKRGHNLV